jgi:mannan endo-1,4-beta-mannosidase
MFSRNCFIWCNKQVRLFAVFIAFSFFALSAFAGFSIQSGFLVDNNGNEFIMRGINYPHVWYTSQTATSIPNIAATGSNCIRIVVGSGQQWGPTPAAEVAQLIQLCKDNKLIAILEVHDCTGYGDTGGYAPKAAPVSAAVDYWLSIQSVLKGQESFVIINIANEPLGNGVPASTWVSVHTDAIARLRQAGLTHTLMVDGATWGQDYDHTMLDNAARVFNSDPLKNVLFSVHMYQVYALRSTIQNYMTTFMTAQLPLVVGEFGPDNGGQPADAISVMDLSQVLGLGYMGWSWSGNSGGTESLDIVHNFNPTDLSTWGNNLINGANGIAATSELASVFGNFPRVQLNPTALSFPATALSATVNVKSNQNWSVSTDQVWITYSPATGANDGSIAVTAAANPNIGPRTGKVTVAGGGRTRTVTVSQIGTGGPGVCNNAVAIAMPFTKEGVGEFCWVTSGDITYVNSWNMQMLEINGVSYANKFASAMPPRINGSYYIHYVGNLPWAHFEVSGSQ